MPELNFPGPEVKEILEVQVGMDYNVPRTEDASPSSVLPRARTAPPLSTERQ